MKDRQVSFFKLLFVLFLLGACSGDQPAEEPIIVNIPDSDTAGADGVASDSSGADVDDFRVPLPFHETVSAGWDHSCAVRADRRLNCFGLGSDADTYEGEFDVDQAVAPEGEFVQVSSGTVHSCGLRPDGEVVCWGIGVDPDVEEEPGYYDIDQGVLPEGNYLAVTANLWSTCAIRDDRRLVCTGFSDEENRFPDGEWKQISVGRSHACGVKVDGSIGCIGHGSDPDEIESAEHDFDQAVPPQGDFVQATAAQFHSCGLRTDSTVNCWGLGSDPDRDEGEYDYDQAVAPEGRFKWVSAGDWYTCGVRESGDVECWGYGTEPGRNQRIADVGQSEPPAGSFVEVSASRLHTCGLREDGEVECWGKNGFGESDPDSEWGADGCERVDHGDYYHYECSPLCQRGCEQGKSCYLVDLNQQQQATACYREGYLSVGDECGDSVWECEGGSTCSEQGDTAYCRQYCRFGDDAEPQCPSGYRCTGPTSVGKCEPI